MTTEELEKKLKISEKTCIHCTTLELAKQVLNIFDKLGLKWCSGNHYIRYTNWDKHKENTVYYPFDGDFSSLKFAHSLGCKNINAEEFITLHTEGKEFDLENYIPKGDLEGFPKEIISRMLECQIEQGNKIDISVFEKQCDAGAFNKGFTWENTKEGNIFWSEVIYTKNFDTFFEKYPKQDNSQEFKVGDEVIDIITRQKGKVLQMNDNSAYPIYVSYKNVSYTLNGKYHTDDKYPRLFHYRDDYDYDVIDFNNLPKRQKPKRWRAENGRLYYFVNFYIKDWFFSDETEDVNNPIDNINYNSGNYFRTEVEAEIIAQKLNEYFKQLIQEEHE